jgi:sigma-B regulation protein RsbU (phosphoserine phosphatase)
MLRNVKIGTKILCVILVISLLTLLIISVISYTQMLNLTKFSQDANIQLGVTSSDESRDALLAQAESYMQNIAIEQSEGSNAILQQVHMEVSAMAKYVERLYAEHYNFRGKNVPFPYETEAGKAGAKYMLAPGVRRTDRMREELRWVSNAEYAFSAMFENNPMLDNFYLGTETGISYRYSRYNSYNASYDPRQRDWYKKAKENPGKAIWLDTYVDAYGVICVTCARAYYDAEGGLLGVVAGDITLTKIIEKILALRVGINGYAFLLDTQGSYIAHPRYNEPGFNTSPLQTAQGSWRKMLESVLAGKKGSYKVNLDGEDLYFFAAHVMETGWTLAVGVPISEVIAPAEETKKKIDIFTGEAQRYIRKTLSDVLMRFIVIFAVSAILVVGFSFALSLTITRPIEELAHNVHNVGAGNLDVKIKVQGRDEIAELGQAFNKMLDNLKEYIKNLNLVTAEKERINGELSVASNIQKDMLPRIFPVFSEHRWLSLFAEMTAAKQVGGDFYDFFFLDKKQSSAVFIIADVSGKGVPAALFMVIAKTLLKTYAMRGLDPAEVLERVNTLLCADNTSCMFVTVFIAKLDCTAHEVRYANAGHNPPLFSRRGGPYEFLKVKKGLPLAAMEEARYKSDKMVFAPGDKIYLYTDGVNEAQNAQEQMFGNEAFLEAANRYRGLPPQEFDAAIRRTISDFAQGVEQWDDITTLAVYFKEEESP